MGNIGQRARTGPEEEQGIKFELIHHTRFRLRITGSFRDIQEFQNPFAIGEDPEFLLQKEHFIRQLPELLINVKILGSHDDLHMTVSLKFEPVSDLRLEVFEISIIPDHTDFIDNQEGVRGELIESDLRVIDEITTGDRISRENSPTTF
jgi:hypothetical protein